MDYETVVAIEAPGTTAGTWACVLNLLGHPVQPLSFISTDTQGHVVYGGAVNPTLANPYTSYTDLSTNFANLFTSYRLLYSGITADLDASALNNQGSIVAAQLPLASERFNVSFLDAASGTFAQPHLDSYNYKSNFPGQQISQMPGAFMGLAQDGIYMPLKLDPHAPWVTTSRMVMVTDANPTISAAFAYSNLRTYGLPDTSVLGSSFPFYGPVGVGTSCARAFCDVSTNGVNGDLTIPFQQTNTGLIVFYNMNPGANLTVKVRWGVEGRVFPTSVLAPAMQPSAMVDPLAMEAYSDLAATLPWAFPSSYNSWDEIVGVLKNAWNSLKPTAASALMSSQTPFGLAAGGLLSILPEAKLTKKQHFERPAGSSGVAARVPAPIKGEPMLAPRSSRPRDQRRKNKQKQKPQQQQGKGKQPSRQQKRSDAENLARWYQKQAEYLGGQL